MAIFNISDLKKVIKRTKLQRDLLCVSLVFSEEEKEALYVIYTQLLTKLKTSLNNQLQLETAKEIKVKQPEFIH